MQPIEVELDRASAWRENARWWQRVLPRTIAIALVLLGIGAILALLVAPPFLLLSLAAAWVAASGAYRLRLVGPLATLDLQSGELRLTSDEVRIDLPSLGETLRLPVAEILAFAAQRTDGSAHRPTWPVPRSPGIFPIARDPGKVHPPEAPRFLYGAPPGGPAPSEALSTVNPDLDGRFPNVAIVLRTPASFTLTRTRAGRIVASLEFPASAIKEPGLGRFHLYRLETHPQKANIIMFRAVEESALRSALLGLGIPERVRYSDLPGVRPAVDPLA